MSVGELRTLRRVVLGLGLEARAQRQVHESFLVAQGLVAIAQLLDEMLAAEGVARSDPDDDPDPTPAA